LSLAPGDFGGGAPNLAIRGVTTGGGNPTVGITVDDAPYGSSTTLGGGVAAPDIDPSDLSRVEVLRGPQGTLYGASSIGGLLKYVTVDPSTEALTGRVQAGISSVHNGNEPGYNARGAVNVPLTDTLAIRASGFVREDPGYIDDPALNENGVNKTIVDGGRLSALWRITPAVSLKLSALLQNMTGHGAPYVDVLPGLVDLQQVAPRGTGEFSRKFQIYTATVVAHLGAAELTAVSGYSVNQISDSVDFTNAFTPLTEQVFGVTGTSLFDHNKTRKITQEVRLSAPLGQRFEWLIGGFYTHENTKFVQDFLAVDPATGQSAGSWVDGNFPQTYTEYAAFTDLTIHFTEAFDVQVGGRESRNRQTYSEVDVGPLEGPDPVVNPLVTTNDNSFTYLVTPRYKFSRDLMAYARFASGYRAGGPNPNSTVFGLPPHFDPDKTQNYEVGFKGDVLDHLLSFDTSLYYIDWKNIQLTVIAPGGVIGYYTNASRAKSEGVELAVESRPLKGLTVAAWIAWNEAVLTEGFPATSQNAGVAGDRLPDSARFTGNLSLDDEFPLAAGFIGFFGGSVSYVGNRQGAFVIQGTPNRQSLPSYASTDLRAGIRYNSWTANIFATNVADKRGVLAGGIGTANPAAFYLLQPRTVGMWLAKTF
jgi:iron complex outermembrane receptor protein